MRYDNIALYMLLIAVLVSAAVFSGCTGETVPVGTQPSVSGNTTETQVTEVYQPIEVVSVRSVDDPSGMVNPGGPTVELTLENICGESIHTLNVTMDKGPHLVYDFGFGVSKKYPLLPGSRISSNMTLIGGGFGGDPPYGSGSYTLTINGTIEDGTSFGFIWESPGYIASTDKGS